MHERVAHGHVVVHLVRVCGQTEVARVLPVRAHHRVWADNPLVDCRAGRDRLHHAAGVVDLGDCVVLAQRGGGRREVGWIVVRLRRHREHGAGLHVHDYRPYALGLVAETPFKENPFDLVLDVVVDREVYVVARTGLRIAFTQDAQFAPVSVLHAGHASRRPPELSLEPLLQAGRAHGVCDVAAHKTYDLR